MKKERCPKCGRTEIRLRWHEKADISDAIYSKRCGKSDVSKDPNEHLHYYCDTCHYDWVGEVKP